MFDEALAFLSAWWVTVPASFAFLLALPFAVAAAGLLAETVRRRRGRG